MDQQPEKLKVGRVLSAHGVHGEMRVEPLTDDPKRFSTLPQVFIKGQSYDVAGARMHSGRVLLRLSGISTPEDVQPLRGEYILISAEDATPLPDDAYYHYQLIGLSVETLSGERLGALVEVIPLEANDIYVVRGERGEVLVPAIKDVVKEIDLEVSRMLVEPVPGLLPWEDAGS